MDNGSQDGSVALIRRDYPGVRIVEIGRNLGAAGGRNAGLRSVDQDLLLLMDNDVALTDDCVDRLVGALESRPGAAIAVPAVVYGQRRDLVQYCGARCHYLGQQILDNEDVPVERISRETFETGSLVSCVLLLDRSRIPGAEYFDESFFIYFEDHEFGLRVRALGSGLVAVPAAQCFHGKGTEGLSIRQLGSYSSRRVFFLIRNRWLILLKIYSLRTWLLLLPMFIAYESAQFLVALRKGWLREWWRSATWIARNLRPIFAERRRFQKLRQVPDGDLLTGGRLPFRAELTPGQVERAGVGVLSGLSACYWAIVGPLLKRGRRHAA
jgi:GT2 family glycosyltransferase